jgi:hypothetical protein
MVSRRTGRLVKKINSMKKIIELVKKFLFGNKVQKVVAVAEIKKEVKKVAKTATKKKK